MKRSGLRLLLVFLVVASAAALYQTYRVDTSMAAERDAAAATERELASFRSTIDELRFAQAGYVATGQTAANWMTRATSLLTQAGGALEGLKTSAGTSDARVRYETASTLLTELTAADTRARNYVTSDQLFLASDVIYVDAADLYRKLGVELEQARTAEAAARTTRLASQGTMRLAVTGAAVLLGLIVAVVMFMRTGSPAPAVDVDVESAPAYGLSLQSARATPAPPASVLPAVPPSAVNLADVADLCGDFSRLQTGQDMPLLLDRTAKVLDARGLVLWVVDTSGAMLRPLFGNGYPDKVMQKLGTLPIDAENVTCLAFRSKQAQVIAARTADACGAIAVPLVTPAGCIGVLAAEIKRAKPDRDTLSAAKMIAAQMAALASPMGDPRAERTAQG